VVVVVTGARQLVGRAAGGREGRIEYGQGPGFHVFPAFDTKELHCQQER
jgi:hypothetical protein